MTQAATPAPKQAGRHPFLWTIGGLFALAAGAFMFWFMLSMGQNMGRMAVDINKFTRPETIMSPFR